LATLKEFLENSPSFLCKENEFLENSPFLETIVKEFLENAPFFEATLKEFLENSPLFLCKENDGLVRFLNESEDLELSKARRGTVRNQNNIKNKNIVIICFLFIFGSLT